MAAIIKSDAQVLFLTLTLTVALATSAFAQQVTVDFRAEGPGGVSTVCPLPYMAGQGFILNAKPLPGSRFIRWEDGSQVTERYLVLPTKPPVYTAYFEEIVLKPYFDEHSLGLDKINPNQRPAATYERQGEKLHLQFVLPARNGFKVVCCTNLATSVFAPVRFALSASVAPDQLEGLGDPGPMDVWVQPPASAAGENYYEILLDNGLTLPALLFAQSATAPPGANVVVYGVGLVGSLSAYVGGTSVSCTLLSSYAAMVALPNTLGAHKISLRLNGTQIMGTVTVTAVSADGLPSLNAFAGITPTPQTSFTISGKGLSTNSLAFVGGTQLQVLNASPDGTALVLRLPQGTTSGLLRVVNAGASSNPVQLTVAAPRFNFAPATSQAVRAYTWDTNRMDRFTYLPATSLNLRVYAWDPAKTERFTYLPATEKGTYVHAP